VFHVGLCRGDLDLLACQAGPGEADAADVHVLG
jgi:hypothetical protein